MGWRHCKQWFIPLHHNISSISSLSSSGKKTTEPSQSILVETLRDQKKFHSQTQGQPGISHQPRCTKGSSWAYSGCHCQNDSMRGPPHKLHTGPQPMDKEAKRCKRLTRMSSFSGWPGALPVSWAPRTQQEMESHVAHVRCYKQHTD